MHHSDVASTRGESEETMYGTHLIQVIYIFYGIGISCAILRIIVRSAITRRLGLEEVVMLFLSACYTGYIACVKFYLINGTNLMTPSERLVVLLNPDRIRDRERGSKALIAAWFLYVTVIWGCKLAIWMVCKRLTDRAATQRKRVQYTGFLLIFSYVVALLTLLTVCNPFTHYWQIDPDPGRNCTDGYHMLLIIGSLNIATDIPLLAIPIPIVFKLQIGWRQKALLLLLFGVGICAIAAAFGRILDVSMNTPSGPSTFWALVETTCALFVSNVPGIQSAFTFLLEFQRTRRSAARISALHSQEYEMRAQGRNRPRTGSRDNTTAQGLSREFSEQSLMGSQEYIVPTDTTIGPLAGSLTKTMTKDLTIVTQPLECELAPEWLSKEETGRGGVRVRSFFPDPDPGNVV